MGPGQEISAAPFTTEALRRKAGELTAREFIEARILPLIHVKPDGNGTDYHSEIVQNTGTGRLTIRYDFGPDNVVFAKAYSDDLGPRCHEINRALWDAGLNANGHYRVPQVIGFLGDHNLLLMRCVPGTPLRAALDGDASLDLIAASRRAATWLVALHRCSLNAGTPDSDWDSLKLFRLISRLIKAVAA
ncbi:MAG: hypothetical protein JO033_23455, partial [Acidobacteriaceae bacterium]|nr:hypothetical protein [Acidobacteriaceae bacterium]